uniref:Uncharacterized protein n=1 Tax=Lotharella globosa TaxID=91324 RepID=A0A7S4DF57_9EUKA
MGSEASSPAARYRKELLKLSWRLVLTVQEQAKSAQESNEASRHSALRDDGKSEISRQDTNLMPATVIVRPFHEDFMTQFFKYCPDLKTKFPSDTTLVSKMIQSFISNAIGTLTCGQKELQQH